MPTDIIKGITDFVLCVDSLLQRLCRHTCTQQIIPRAVSSIRTTIHSNISNDTKQATAAQIDSFPNQSQF